MNDKLIDHLKLIAQRRTFADDPGEDVCVDDYAVGNVDDAYRIGERAGEALLARYILDQMNIEFTIDDE